MKNFRLLIILSIIQVAKINSTAQNEFSDFNRIITDGKALVTNGEFGKAIHILNPIINSSQSISDLDSELVGEAFHLVANCYKNTNQKSESLANYITALNFYKKDSINNKSQIGQLYYDLADYYLSSRTGDLVIYYTQKIIGEYKNDKELLSKAYSLLAFIQLYREDFNNSILNFTKARETLNMLIEEETLIYADYYSKIGTYYNRIGDIHKAMQYYKRALEIYKKELPSKHILIAGAINDYAFAFKNIKNYENALLLFQEAVLIMEGQYTKDNYSIGAIYSNIGTCYSEIDNLDTALSFFYKGLKNKMISINENHFLLCREYNLIGDIFIRQKELKKASKYFNKSIQILQHDNKYALRVHLANARLGLGRIAEIKKNYSTGIQLYEEALQDIGFSFDKSRNGNLFVSRSSNVIKLLERLANAKYLASQNLADKEKAWEVYEIAFEFLERLRGEFIEPFSKQNLYEQHFDLFESAIGVALNLYSKTSETEYFETAFNLSERIKNILLLESIKIRSEEIIKMIPQQFLKREFYLRDTINKLERKILSEGFSSRINSENIKQYENELFDTRIEYDSLKTRIQSYIGGDISALKPLNYIKNDMFLKGENNLSIIEYFVGKNKIYSFVISKDTMYYTSADIELDLNSTVENFRKGIYGYFIKDLLTGKKLTIEEANDLFAKNSEILYKLLIEPLHRLEEELLIIPDGVLGYVPFELLIKQIPKDLYNYKKYDFLILDKTIRYNYSISLLEEMRRKKYEPKGSLVVAPDFSVNYDTSNLKSLYIDHEDLINTEKVAALLDSIIDAKCLVKKEATIKNFTKLKDRYDIIHFETHAEANDNINNLSYVAFSELDVPSNKNLLISKEIYGMSIYANMVYLGACETGIGNLMRGEGIMSLARSFSHSGVKSIIPSLWKISDNNTPLFTRLFYTNLVSGNSKSRALKNAKLSFLEHNQDIQAHPFFWGGIIMIGDDSPLVFKMNKTKNDLILRIIYVFLILATILLFYYRIKK